MKHIIESLLNQALQSLMTKQILPVDLSYRIHIERTRDQSHGDFATNLALTLAAYCDKNTRALAAQIVDAIPSHDKIAKIEIAGPGFINFFLLHEGKANTIVEILNQKSEYGQSKMGLGTKVLLEFVSANPTGPLHVGHGRSAAFGATLANILRAASFEVCTEYYVNDAGRQMSILAVSVWLRYLELCGLSIIFPVNAYHGHYVEDIAKVIFNHSEQKYRIEWSLVIENLPPDEPEGGDKEKYIDAVIVKAEKLLGPAGFAIFHKTALDYVLSDIQEDLAEFGVHYNQWFSEATLTKNGSIEKSIAALKKAGHVYEKEGALWFQALKFGDEKDRVLVRSNGQTTYFASDVAYHWNKYHREFDRVIDIFGADHHGYVSRIKAAVRALGHDDNALNILLVQFAILYRNGVRVQMSTRSGSFVTLRELREEVGNDAARFFYVMRKSEQHMDFDLDLAKSQSNDNPVYYIQYAHARICSVLRQLAERGLKFAEKEGLQALARLEEPHEKSLIDILCRYPEVLELSARECEVHHLAYYLRDLANGLHSYYNAIHLLCEDSALRMARLCLLKAVQQVLLNGLTLLGVTAPESM